jgi:hypothetical protein
MKKPKHPTSNNQHPTPNQELRAAQQLRESAAGQRKYDLEERLLVFASAVIDLSEKLPNSRAGRPTKCTYSEAPPIYPNW